MSAYCVLLFCAVDEISDLNDRLAGLQQTKDKDREMFEQQLEQLRNEYQETKRQLSSDNMMLGTYVIYLFQLLLWMWYDFWKKLIK